MNDLLTEAKLILADTKSDGPARDFMTNGQRDAIAEDFESREEFLSASHFHSDAEKSKEFERLFWENIKPKSD